MNENNGAGEGNRTLVFSLEGPKYRVFLSGGILSVKAAFCGVAPVILEQEGKGSLSIVPSREMFGGG